MTFERGVSMIWELYAELHDVHPDQVRHFCEGETEREVDEGELGGSG